MNIKFLGLSLITAALLSTTAHASTFKNDRGYKACERSLEEKVSLPGVTFERLYMVKQDDAGRTFFINSTAWNDAGERQTMNSTCITSPNGREVLQLETDLGAHLAAEDIVAAL